MNQPLNIQNKKLEIIHWLSTIDDDAIINKIIELRNLSSHNLWENISLSEKESIENGINDAAKDKLTEHNEVRRIYEKWL